MTRPSPSVKTVLRVAVLAAVYVAAAKLGLKMALVAEQVSPVWPPTGIALAAVLLWGYAVWPGIWLGAFVANLGAHEPLGTAAGIAVGNTLEPVLGAWLVHRVVGFHPALDRIRDVLAFVGGAALVATMVSATIGVASLCAGGVQPCARFGELWWIWWIGDAVGALVVTPLLLTAGRAARRRWRSSQVVEGGALLAVLVTVCTVVFAEPGSQIGQYPLEYLVFPFMIWAALRFGQAGASTVTLVVAAIAIWGSVRGFGTFAAAGLHDRLVLLQLFLAVVATTGLVLAATMHQRRLAERRRAIDLAATRALAESRSLTDAAPRILRAICEGLDWDFGAVWIVDESAAVLRCVETWHAGTRSVVSFEQATRERTFVAGVGLPGRVWQSGQPAWIPDVVPDPNFPRAPIAEAAGLRGWFGFPIVLQTDTLGVLEFFSHEIERPDPALLDSVRAIGIQIGLFIERRRAEAREQALRTQAEAASRAKDDFLGMLGHELRNPLGAIVNAVQLFGVVETPAEYHQIREIIARQSAQMTKLVDDLLEVSRITAGRIELKPEPVDLRASVERHVALLRGKERAAKVTIRIDGPPTWVDADVTRLEQIVVNLLDNAVKFTPAGGKIHLTVGSDEPGMATLRVRDTGIGIPPDLLPRIFEPFVQVGQSLDRGHGGLGLGLTIVRKLVELHGGTIAARSGGSGAGAEFIVRLPAREAPAAAPEARTAAPTPMVARRLLVIEDNADARETLRLLLKADGHVVEVAADGATGLEKLRTGGHEVALIDVGLPGMDGYQVARAARLESAGARPYLVAVTGYGQARDVERARDAGFDAHLVKPVEYAQLRRLIAEAPGRAP